ncbi:MAG: hypothetical protein IIW92_11825 [Lachnospiraceae bacterium]|nr:hypothetical protein [Lachnospiraceae bacterium]
MGKYHGVGGFRVGKVGNERYYLRKRSNVVAVAKPYKAINSQWIKQEEFKEYILSLLTISVPQVYVLDSLPEELYPYALLFVQEGNFTDIYLDKDGLRTHLIIEGGGGGFEPTSSQLAAMNSGIDTTKREGYDLAVTSVSGLDRRMTTAEDTLDAIENALESKADKSTTYTKSETDNLLSDKLNKRTSGENLNVYSHIGSAQGEMEVLGAISQRPKDSNLLSEKGVYDALQERVPVVKTSGAELYCHIGSAQTTLPKVTTINEVSTDNQIPSAAAVFQFVYVSNLVVYDANTGYDGIFTQLHIPENSSKSGYLVNFNPAIVAGASRNEGYITAYNRNDGTKLIEFITYDKYEKWYVLKKNGVWSDVCSALSYRHTLVRYNNDSYEYPMGWCVIINDKPSMTFSDVKTWLTSNGYTSATNCYAYCGGCCGTTGVRNKEDTGTTYIGRVCSGIFIDTGTATVYFKYDYNGTVQVSENRCRITTTH